MDYLSCFDKLSMSECRNDVVYTQRFCNNPLFFGTKMSGSKIALADTLVVLAKAGTQKRLIACLGLE